MMSEDDEEVISIQNNAEEPGETVVDNETMGQNPQPASDGVGSEETSFKSCEGDSNENCNENPSNEKADENGEEEECEDSFGAGESSKITVESSGLNQDDEQEQDKDADEQIEENNTDEEEAVNDDLLTDEILGDEDENAEDPMAVGNELDGIENDNQIISVPEDLNTDSVMSGISDSNEAITGDTKRTENETDELKQTEETAIENEVEDVEMTDLEAPDSELLAQEAELTVKAGGSSKLEIDKQKVAIESLDDDEDDIIIEEGPTDRTVTQSTPVDSTSKGSAPITRTDCDMSELILGLELVCEDEALEFDQLVKAKNIRQNFETMLKDVAKLKKKNRVITASRQGSQLVGVLAQAPQQFPLVRPPVINTAQPIRFMQQSVANGQPIQLATSTGQIIRTSSGVQQIPQILYDTQSGLLLMPTNSVGGTIGGIRLPLSQTNTISTIGGVQTSIAGARPRFVYSTAQTFQAQNRARLPISGVRQNTAPTIVSSVTRPQVVASLNHPRVPTGTARPSFATRPGSFQQIARPSGAVSQIVTRQPLQPRPPPLQSRPTTAATAIRPQVQQQTDKNKNNATDVPADQNPRTFPSLVVTVKPCMLDKPNKVEQQKSRADLDSKVKALLVYTPAKFTEWLMQRGLLRLEHKCNLHFSATNEQVSYKLGMYSDGNKQPFSGGYVWISECCPDKQISVFQGSIFEASVYPPGTLFKLIYHWSCQTTAVNVLQWVKVTSYYLKNFYTLLRSACVAALHEFSKEMGGPGKYVEVGIITLGTTMPNQSNGSKQVKIEILGVFDPLSKAIRMKVVNPQSPSASAAANKSRVLQILWPLKHWVHKDSTIVIDTGIERSLILEMGFKSVIQTKLATPTSKTTPTNSNVMNYLKHVIPKIFQNTLCVLSKSLIQQFLDELSWRELWGQTSGCTFDNIINHLVQMTKWDTGEPLITRLNRISLNPFGEWSYSKRRTSRIDMLPDSIRSGAGVSLAPPQLSSSSRIPPKINLAPLSKFPSMQPSSVNGGQANKRKGPDMTQLIREQKEEFSQMIATQPRTLLLHSYYYAESTPEHLLPPLGLFPPNLKCPLCSKQFMNNLEVVRHILVHVQNLGIRSQRADSFCDYCMKDVGHGGNVTFHVNDVHRMIGAPYACLICQEKFNSEKNLILHMWENHCKYDMPYRCELCDYKNSFHYEVVNHFLKDHSGWDAVLCPYCLKVLSAKSFSCMKQIVVHLQTHAIRKGRKCQHCALMFGTDADLRGHLAEGAHQETELNETGRIITAFQNDDDRIKMAKPPSRVATKSLPPPVKKLKSDEPVVNKSLNVFRPILRVGDGGATQIEDFRTKYILRSNLPKCLECHKNLDSHNHLPAFISCVKCRFSTSCRASMNVHLSDCHPSNEAEACLKPSVRVNSTKPLSCALSCPCGYEAKSPQKMAGHLVNCNKYTAKGFSSEESELLEKPADQPTSFLGQLGLTRNES